MTLSSLRSASTRRRRDVSFSAASERTKFHRQQVSAAAAGWAVRLLESVVSERPAPFAAPRESSSPRPSSWGAAWARGADQSGHRLPVGGRHRGGSAPGRGVDGVATPLLLGLGMAAGPLIRALRKRTSACSGWAAEDAAGQAPQWLDPDDALERTLGSGLYQLCVFAFVGLGFYSFTFPFQVMAVFTDGKMAADPGLPAFTKDALSYASSLFFLGWLVGAILVGPLTDRWGRRPVVFGGMLGLLVSGAVAVIVPSAVAGSFTAFAVARFCVGVFNAVGTSASVLVQECIPGELRARAMWAINTAYSLTAAAQAFLCGTATLAMDWRVETLLWYVPSLVGLLLGLPVVGESLRFLVARGRKEEAQALLERIARTNGVAASAKGVTVVAPELLAPPPAAGQAEKELARGSESDEGGKSLLSRQLLLRVCAMAACWATCAMTNYGLLFSAGELSPNLYTNSLLLYLVDIFGYAIVLGADTFGRRAMQSACFMAAGLCLLLCGVMGAGTWPVVACALAGRLFINACFTTVYLLVVELFPTDCRSAALGVCNVAARCGGLFAPLSRNFPAAVSCPIFGVACMGSALLTLRLPETSGQKLG